MKKFKIIPQYREGCFIQGKKEDLLELNVGDTIFLISDSPSKKYSIFSKIEALDYNNEAKIFIDKRILGNFGENDEIFILKYNPAEAIEVHINISDDFSFISKGDWTSNIKPSLKNKLIDVGQEVSFLINWEGGAPIIGSGIINSTLPNPPVYIGSRTLIYIEKISKEQIYSIKREKLKIQEQRVDILCSQIKQKTIQSIKKIKQKNYPSKGQKYYFKATNPKQLFCSVLNIFKGLDSIEDPKEQYFGIKEHHYLASAVFAFKQNFNLFILIDIQIVASEKSGFLLLWITGKDKGIVSKLLNKYNVRISELKSGFEEKIDVISLQCPECGGTLPVNNIDINGIVECIYCNKISIIPKALRY